MYTCYTLLLSSACMHAPAYELGNKCMRAREARTHKCKPILTNYITKAWPNVPHVIISPASYAPATPYRVRPISISRAASPQALRKPRDLGATKDAA